MWVVPELREDGRIYWLADSDSQLTKVRGLGAVCGGCGSTGAACLGAMWWVVRGLDGRRSSDAQLPTVGTWLGCGGWAPKAS